MPYPWDDGDLLSADELNAAIAGVSSGPAGVQGASGVLIETGYGPPTGSAPEDTTYFDLSNGDVWTFGEAPAVPYHAPAVRFPDAAALYRASVVAVDNAFFSFSFWQRADSVSTPIFHWFNSAGAPSCDIMSPGDPSGKTDVYLSDPSGDSWLDVMSATYDKTVWHHFLGAFDTGALKRAAFYVDDTDAGATVDPGGVAFINAVNAAGVQICGGSGDVDLADLRIMPGVNLLDGTGHIPMATRRLFIDAAGKPVDPVVATAALSAPCILFSGDVVSFPVNQGTGGAFTRSDNGVDVLTDAPTSPSD